MTRRATLLALDLPALGAVLLVAVAGYFLHGALTRPRLVDVELAGLRLRLPADYSLRDPPIVPTSVPLRVAYRHQGDAAARIEVRVEPRPLFTGAVDSLRELDRARRLGDGYRRLELSRQLVGGAEWLRTRYTYPAEAGPVTAIEYAYPADPAVNGDRLYIVTVMGGERRARWLEDRVLGSLALPGGRP
jgi:hypothetical protein